MPEAPLVADGLVRHPPPYPTESLFGYVLRLAEENGYPTPNTMLARMGFEHEQLRNRQFPLREFARVAHRKLCELERIAYQYSGQYRLLGQPVALPDQKRFGRVSLCPECVRSAGFIEAHWDLELMTGCPVHRTRLLSCCPKCHLTLRWPRPGQLECTCGARFTRVEGPILPEGEAELLEVVRCKVLGLQVSHESSTGMPIRQLSALSLRGLLYLIRTLARFHLQLGTVKHLDDPQSVVTAAAYVLRSFPANFHALLWTVGEQHVPKQCGGSVRTQFKHIYESLFKFKYAAGDPRGSRDFLASAFLDFALNQWGRGFVEGTLLQRIQRTMPKRYVTRAEFGQFFGLGRRTTKRVLALKNISTMTIRGRRRNRVIIDLQQLHEPPMVSGKIVTLRTAAATIGVSARVLRKLRASGHFEVKYHVKRDGYHERDINQFIERLLALNSNSMNSSLPRDCITLYQAMCQGTGVDGASIIRALLSGELRVLGNADGTARGLFVSRVEFKHFGRNERARQNGNARTVQEVAKEIHCDERCVPGLVGRKLLDGWDTPKGCRISEESIARFKEKYVSLVSTAREIGSKSGSLMRHCQAKRIPMIIVKHRSEKRKTAFVRLRDRNAVLSYRPPSVKRRDYGGLSLFPDLETVEQLPKQSSRLATVRVKRRDYGGLSLFPNLETVEQFPKRVSKPINSPGCGTPA